MQYAGGSVPVYAVYPPSRRYSTKVRVFVDWAQQVFSGLRGRGLARTDL